MKTFSFECAEGVKCPFVSLRKLDLAHRELNLFMHRGTGNEICDNI